MKILIIRNAFGYDFGGAERLSVHIAQELTQNGVASLIVSRHTKLLEYAKSNSIPTHKGMWWSKQRWSGIHLILFPLYIFWQLILYFEYLRLIRQFRPDAVHIMSKDDFIAATYAAHSLGKRVIWTDCADLKHVFSNHSIWYKNPVGKLVFQASKYADVVTLVSRSEQMLIEDSLQVPVPKNFRVIHIAGKDEVVSPVVRESSDRSAIIFSSTSRLVIDKGISELIEAFKLLSQNSSNYRLWLLGEGPDRDIFTEQAAHNKYIHFLGHQVKPLEYVASSDIFVHPTYHEGFSLSLTEAAMLGKPMIATEVGGNPELVNAGNGILVPVRDVSSLYEAMKSLADNPDLRIKLGSNARDDYKKYFDFSTIVKKEFLVLYEKDYH